MPLKIAVIGAGDHARQHHLPALDLYRRECPGAIELRALCDLNLPLAREQGARFGFTSIYGAIDQMLAAETLDAIIVLTSVSATWPVTRRLLHTGLPLLIEKPPGATLEEARALVDAARGARVMVSMNRRFDPIIAAGANRLAGRRVRHIHCRFARVNRTESTFLTETGLHGCDTVRFLAGDPDLLRIHTVSGAGCARTALIEFAGGITCVMDILPCSGSNAERYEVTGNGFSVEMRSALFDEGIMRVNEQGKAVEQLRVPLDREPCIRSGTDSETRRFLEAVRTGQLFEPTPQRVLKSVELSWLLQAPCPEANVTTSPSAGSA